MYNNLNFNDALVTWLQDFFTAMLMLKASPRDCQEYYGTIDHEELTLGAQKAFL